MFEQGYEADRNIFILSIPAGLEGRQTHISCNHWNMGLEADRQLCGKAHFLVKIRAGVEGRHSFSCPKIISHDTGSKANCCIEKNI